MAYAADGDIVRLGAGEVLQGGAEALVGDGAQIHLYTRVQDDCGTGGSLRQYLFHLIVADEALHRRCLLRCADQDVQIPHRFLGTTVTAGDRNLTHARRPFEVGEQGFGVLGGDGEFKANPLTQVCIECLQDVLFGFFTKARELPDRAAPRGVLQLFQRPYAQFIHESLDAFGSQPRQGQHLGDAGRKGVAQFLELRGRAGFDEFLDFGGQVLADAGKSGKVFALFHHGAQFRSQVSDDE